MPGYSIDLWFGSKVKQKPEIHIGRAEIVENLTSSGSVELVRRFHFYDEHPIDDHIQALADQ